MLPHLYSWVLQGPEEMKGSNALRGAHPDFREKEDVSFFLSPHATFDSLHKTIYFFVEPYILKKTRDQTQRPKG